LKLSEGEAGKSGALGNSAATHTSQGSSAAAAHSKGEDDWGDRGGSTGAGVSGNGDDREGQLRELAHVVEMYGLSSAVRAPTVEAFLDQHTYGPVRPTVRWLNEDALLLICASPESGRSSVLFRCCPDQ
jgi:hypothetical protein